LDYVNLIIYNRTLATPALKDIWLLLMQNPDFFPVPS
jgi:hypothetical protein